VTGVTTRASNNIGNISAVGGCNARGYKMIIVVFKLCCLLLLFTDAVLYFIFFASVAVPALGLITHWLPGLACVPCPAPPDVHPLSMTPLLTCPIAKGPNGMMPRIHILFWYLLFNVLSDINRGW